jgi:hypothetical protein
MSAPPPLLENLSRGQETRTSCGRRGGDGLRLMYTALLGERAATPLLELIRAAAPRIVGSEQFGGATLCQEEPPE